MLDARITGEPLDASAEFASFLDRVDGEGAVTSFVGVARPAARDGVEVSRLFLDHHPTLTQASVLQIAQDARDRFLVTNVCIVHRWGKIIPAEAIVFVAAAAAHRRAAFDAVDYMMDRLKTEATFWKREDTARGSHWIEPTDGDHIDRARWKDNDAD